MQGCNQAYGDKGAKGTPGFWKFECTADQIKFSGIYSDKECKNKIPLNGISETTIPVTDNKVECSPQFALEVSPNTGYKLAFSTTGGSAGKDELIIEKWKGNDTNETSGASTLIPSAVGVSLALMAFATQDLMI